MKKNVKVYYYLYYVDFILCFIVIIMNGSLCHYTDCDFSKYVVIKMFQINETLNDIYKKINSV